MFSSVKFCPGELHLRARSCNRSFPCLILGNEHLLRLFGAHITFVFLLFFFGGAMVTL